MVWRLCLYYCLWGADVTLWFFWIVPVHFCSFPCHEGDLGLSSAVCDDGLLGCFDYWLTHALTCQEVCPENAGSALHENLSVHGCLNG